ncbi:MAG: hypothetical protein J6A21_02645 [Lentisphaeria bacterium]|nr:hypothetical protein [Lentisphaeria bacterium]
MQRMMKKTLFGGVLFLLLSGASMLFSEELNVNFARDKWDRSKWLEVKSPRLNYVGKMVQKEDHIINWTPDLPDEVIFKKHSNDVYSCIMYDKFFSGRKVEIRSKMSFDHRMAPLIVLAGEMGKSRENVPELSEHFEIVLYDQGINVWHHMIRDGKPFWHKAAFLKTPYEKGKIYELKIVLEKSKGIMQMTIECDGKVFGYQDEALPDKFLTGVIGCEGRCRFYDFNVKTIPEKAAKKAPAKVKK